MHVINRSIVAKCFIIGSYWISDESKYKPTPNKPVLLGKHVKLSNQLPCMCIGNDNLYVSDEKRGEILVVCKVFPAKAVRSARIHILTVENCVAMCFVSNYLVVLHQDEQNCAAIFRLSFTFPPRKSHTVYISHNVISSFVPECEIKGLFTVFNSEVCFGGWSKDNAVYFFKESKKKWIGYATTCTSSTHPCTNFQSLLSVNNSNEILLYQLDVKKQNVAICSEIRTVKCPIMCHIFSFGGRSSTYYERRMLMHINWRSMVL